MIVQQNPLPGDSFGRAFCRAFCRAFGRAFGRTSGQTFGQTVVGGARVVSGAEKKII